MAKSNWKLAAKGYKAEVGDLKRHVAALERENFMLRVKLDDYCELGKHFPKSYKAGIVVGSSSVVECNYYPKHPSNTS